MFDGVRQKIKDLVLQPLHFYGGPFRTYIQVLHCIVCRPLVIMSIISKNKPAAKQQWKRHATVALVVDGGSGTPHLFHVSAPAWCLGFRRDF